MAPQRTPLAPDRPSNRQALQCVAGAGHRRAARIWIGRAHLDVATKTCRISNQPETTHPT
jgi:hypothetical protein